MPYASDRDRNPTLLELEKTPWPLPPLNVFLTSGFMPGVFDLSWDNPQYLALNSRFHICGVNIYRSFDSEFGPYDRINDYPIGSINWRDQTDNVLIVEEPVMDDMWVHRGVCEGNQALSNDQYQSEATGERYVFRTQHCPLVEAGSQARPEYNPESILVTVDGVRVPVLRTFPDTGEIEIDPRTFPNVATQSRDTPTLPLEGTDVRVTYRYNRFLLKTDLSQRVFYRITAVGLPTFRECKLQAQDLVETPLERAAFTSSREIEKLDYIWKEAVRRNRWILDQGGERVKVFLRKQVGQPCPCAQSVFDTTHKQNGLSDCLLCFGTGILGGYEGPYDMVVAPDDADRKIAQTDTGRTVEHSYEVWTGPSPLLSQRDFIVKINGERWSIGAVRMPTNRGMVLQQHFMIGHLDEQDIRYRVPVDSPRGLVINELSPVIPPQHFAAEVTEKPNIPDERELRGRNKVWENIMYAFPFFLLLRTLVDVFSSGCV